jgi:hypothetical protein
MQYCEHYWPSHPCPILMEANSMTCLDMQKQNATPDPLLESILRQAEKRHTITERIEKSGRESSIHKPSQSRADDLEWEFCLRRYFDYLDSRSMAARSDNSYSSTSDRSQHSDSRSFQNASSITTMSIPGRAQGPVRNFSYRSFRQGEITESQYGRPRTLLDKTNPCDTPSYNEIYTRPRRHSTASTNSAISITSGSSRTNSFTSSFEPHMSPTTDYAYPRSPIFGPSTPWQQAPVSSTHPEGNTPWSYASPSSQDESMTRAMNDIITTTPYLPPGEARAYIQGRLAGLDPTSTAQIRHSLSMDNMTLTSSSSVPSLKHLTLHPATTQEEHNFSNGELGSTSNLSSAQKTGQLQLSRAVSAPVPIIKEPKARRNAPSRSTGGSARPNLGRRGSKKRMSAIRLDHSRSLSTIIERPSTALSKVSKAESNKSRKSIFSLKKEKAPIMPDMLHAPSECRSPSISESVKSAGSSTLRGSTPDKSRIVELEDIDEDSPGIGAQRNRPAQRQLKPAVSKQQHHQNLKSAMTRSSHSDLQSAISKQLPLTPGDLHQSNPVKRMANFLGFTKSRKKNVALPSSISTPQLTRAMQSAESLQKASLDCLRKSGSKSTLCVVAIQEGPEQPFQVWLSALPYIEGRAATPSPRI